MLINALYGLIAFTFLQALASFFLAARIKSSRLLLQGQIVWDLLFSLCVIYLTRGSESPFPFLFILVIVSSSVFFSRREVLLVAAAAAILYGSLVDLQYYGYLPYFDDMSRSGELSTPDFFYAVFVNIVAFFSTALLAGLLAERLRRSETELRKREVDYDELENLNRTIVTSIASGLMSINGAGRIRLFNAAAEEITGLRFAEVYNADIREIFPQIQVFTDGPRVVRRGEATFRRRDGNTCILGYASSRLFDARGEMAGLLISFQDLTDLKEMERRLQRVDRLAAVGQLASGMAHEIRNPLASISGSVQLLLEGEGLDPHQQRLMRIVVKEADRLSQLLTDFLLFARPRQLKLDLFNFAELGQEVVAVCNNDPRFSEIAVRNNCPPGAMIRADRQQLGQALWNLLINSAEAITGDGTIWLGLTNDAMGTRIVVEDDGPGVPKEQQERIFDPFFSTKDRGSGLGLATVHAIVTAHGGEILCEERPTGGARFVLVFPEVVGSGTDTGYLKRGKGTDGG